MPKSEAARLADSFQAIVGAAINQLDDTNAFRLRSELQAIRAVVHGGRGDKAAAAAADKCLETVTRFYGFATEIRGFVLSREFSQKATLFDLGSVGILSIENVLTAEKPNLFRILMSGLAEGLMFLGSRQYIYGSSAALDGLYRAHSAALYDELWSLATDFRGPLNEKAAREVQVTLDEFFTRISAPGIPVDARVSGLYQLYGIVVVLRCVDVLQRLRA